MEANHKRVLKAVVLELRHMFEGYYDDDRMWHAGDLERRLNALGVWREREPLAADELAQLTPADREARRVVDAYLKLRLESDVPQAKAVGAFVRETAYTWANRLLALRCMEARELIDEVILQKPVYSGRSLEHNRLAQRRPELCAGEDDGLFVVLDASFSKQAQHLPLLFDPRAPGVALKPGAAALKRAIALLSGTKAVRGQEPATSKVFRAPDAFGWAYQYWNTEEKNRVFEKVRTQEGAKIEGADIIPATQLYTEPYMVKFLVQNSLGATWLGMYPQTKLPDRWEYFVKDADRACVKKKPVREITFLDPACGSGHFLLEAFDIFYSMYEEDGDITEPEAICCSILEYNLYGIDIDERAIQITEAALWMKAAEKVFKMTGAPSFTAVPANLVATNMRLPRGKDHLQAFLEKHPEDKDLSSALEVVFSGLENADELGSLLQIETPVEAKLQELEAQVNRAIRHGVQTDLYKSTALQGQLPPGVESYDDWKEKTLGRLNRHFAEEGERGELSEAFFSRAAGRGLRLFDLLARRYDVVAANPPYLSFRNLGTSISSFLREKYASAPTDTYSAMLWRSLDLLSPNGRVAYVTQDGLLLLPSLSELRDRMLANTQLEVVAHLGPRAFEDISGEKVSVALTVAHNVEPFRVPVWVRLVNVQDKAEALKTCVTVPSAIPSNGLSQHEYLATRNKQWLYFAPRRLVQILAAGETLEQIALVKQGIITGDNDRFVRYWWEVAPANQRWCWYYFGSEDILFGAGGLPLHLIDWRHGATWRFIRPRAEELRFREGVAFGRLGKAFRVVRLPAIALFDVNASAAIFNSRKPEPWVIAYLSAPIINSLLHALNVSLTFLIQDIAGVPMPKDFAPEQVAALRQLGSKLSDRRAATCSKPITSASYMRGQRRSADADDETDLLSAIDSHVQSVLGLSDDEVGALHDLEAVISAAQDDSETQEAGPTVAETIDHGYPSSISLSTLRCLGHRWPKQIDPGEPLPEWAAAAGIIPLTEGPKPTLLECVRERICAEFEGGDLAAIEREFAEIMGVPVEHWLTHEFFGHHTSQFKKRPIAWQLQSGTFNARRKPGFACLLYYQRLSGQTLTTIQSQYVRPLRQRYESEVRGIESVPVGARSERQQERLTELMNFIPELRGFDEALDAVSRTGFGPANLGSELRQYAINDAMLCLKSRWLGKLSGAISAGPAKEWQQKAKDANLHPSLPQWVTDAMVHLRHHCSAVGPKAPKEATLKLDPAAVDLAALISEEAGAMVGDAVRLACVTWWMSLDEVVFAPVRAQIKGAKDELKMLKEEDLGKADRPFMRRKEIEARTKELRENIKHWQRDLDGKTEKAKNLREHILGWRCPEAATWGDWLAAQPMYDAISSLDGVRQPPCTVAKFISQESAYAPDINDGVRINIAPLQQAGLLAADVLAPKDVDKAIADRAEWRADERRWCREGKLPQPGWWLMEKKYASGQD